MSKIITLQQVKKDPKIQTLVEAANSVLEAIGYTEHGRRHVGYVSNTAAKILRELDYPQRIIELAAITGWIHDVGNAINRKHHGLTGATLLYPILSEIGFDIDEIAQIITAIGNHEEHDGVAVSELSAALIIADKSDAHRTRVRAGKYDPYDIHDRVNYAIKKNWIYIDKENKLIRYEMIMDDSSSVMEFMDIYLRRMRMCEESAKYLGCRLLLVVNNTVINNMANTPHKEK